MPAHDEYVHIPDIDSMTKTATEERQLHGLVPKSIICKYIIKSHL